MTRKTLILAIDLCGGQDWQITALQRQMADWLNINRAILPIENLIILPTQGDMRLFWLEGECVPGDIKTLEEIRDRIKPVLEVALDIKIDKQGLFKVPRSVQTAKARFNRLRPNEPQ